MYLNYYDSSSESTLISPKASGIYILYVVTQKRNGLEPRWNYPVFSAPGEWPRLTDTLSIAMELGHGAFLYKHVTYLYMIVLYPTPFSLNPLLPASLLSTFMSYIHK